jgi:hypothetical protein
MKTRALLLVYVAVFGTAPQAKELSDHEAAASRVPRRFA